MQFFFRIVLFFFTFLGEDCTICSRKVRFLENRSSCLFESADRVRLVLRELTNARRQRQRKRHLKISDLYFTCPTSRLFKFVQLLHKRQTFNQSNLVRIAFQLRKRMKNSPSCVVLQMTAKKCTKT